MNPQLIAAFHNYNSFKDIVRNSDISLKELERLVIDLVRSTHELPLDSDSDPDNESDIESNESDIESNESESESTKIQLSEEQLDFVDRAVSRENLFLTASAGYGKSHVIATAVHQLRARYDKPGADVSSVAVCASTGRAASLLNIGSARTLHSYLGIGLAKQSADELYERLITVRRMRPKYHELRALKVLIIDEISMINHVLLDKISIYLELIKDCTDPFGGIQMIFVGDLYQLPPIEGKYFFESAAYKDCHATIIQLTKCFRQSDTVFQQVLNEARMGELSNDSYKILLAQKSIDSKQFKGIKPMQLRPTNREVSAINARELNKLVKETGESIHTYKIVPILSDKKRIETVAKMEDIPLEFDVAVGCQIMVTANVSMANGQRISNGSMGTVLEIYADHIMLDLVQEGVVKLSHQKVVDPDSDEFSKNPKYLFEYLPIRLGFSISIHKAQGCSVDCLSVDLSSVFGFAMGYVAISRCRSLAGLQIIGLKKGSFRSDPKITEFYQRTT